MNTSGVVLCHRLAICAVDLGPVGVWVGGAATFCVALIALVGSLGGFDRFRAPRLVVSFEQIEPWCRVRSVNDEELLWMRMGVENIGKQPARGCVGRLTGITTNEIPRADIDPIQLRWAGIPRSQSFNPIDVRRGQREFLNMLSLRSGSGWQIVTFEDPDFDPGFTTELDGRHEHELHVAVFSDNARTVTTSLVVKASGDGVSVVARLREK